MSVRRLKRGVDVLRREGVSEFSRQSLGYMYDSLLLDSTHSSVESMSPEELVAYAEKYGEVYKHDVELADLPHHLPVEEVPPEVADDVDWSDRRTCVLKDASLIGIRGVSKTDDGRFNLDSAKKPYYFREAISASPHHFVDPAFLPQPFDDIWRSWVERDAHEFTEVVNMVTHGPQDANFGHWLTEYLTKLFHVRQYEQRTGRKLKLVIDNDPEDWLVESLDLLGFEDDRRIEWDDTVARVDRLVVPLASSTVVQGQVSYSPIEFQWLRGEFVDRVEPTDDDPSRIYVSRQEYDTIRDVGNFDEIKPVLDEYDITVVTPEQHGFEEVVRMLAGAELVAGVSGSGLFHILCCEDTTLLELHTTHEVWKTTATVLGHSYERLYGRRDPEQTIPDNMDPDLNHRILVSPSELEASIQSILA